MKRRYTVLIERGPTSFGATVPDLPGCVALARSRRAVLKLIAEAIPAHVASLEADGEVVPAPVHEAVMLEVGDGGLGVPQLDHELVDGFKRTEVHDHRAEVG